VEKGTLVTDFEGTIILTIDGQPFTTGGARGAHLRDDQEGHAVSGRRREPLFSRPATSRWTCGTPSTFGTGSATRRPTTGDSTPMIPTSSASPGLGPRWRPCKTVPSPAVTVTTPTSDISRRRPPTSSDKSWNLAGRTWPAATDVLAWLTEPLIALLAPQRSRGKGADDVSWKGEEVAWWRTSVATNCGRRLIGETLSSFSRYWVLSTTDSHLPGALNLPPDKVAEMAPTLLPDKEAEIVLYCWDEG
jgi:hypothetical protein